MRSCFQVITAVVACSTNLYVETQGWGTFDLFHVCRRAAEFDRVDIVKYLLDIGADMEAKDNANRTAFVCAVKRGRTRAAEMLLESGADFESRDEALRTCIHLAVQYERVDTLRMLLDRDQGKLINERDKDLRTPLHYAAKLGSLKVKYIISG